MGSEMCIRDSFHAPKKSIKVRNNHAPWLTRELKLMFQRDKLKRVANINKTEANWNSYKSARNTVNIISIKKAKAEYYERYFEVNMGDMRKIWKGINMIKGRSSRTTEITNIIVDDSCYTIPNDISIALCSFYEDWPDTSKQHT